VDAWVLSCRAFSRRIEHRTLQELFHHLQLSQIILNFVATNRNGPFQEFLSSIQPALFSNNPPTVSNISAL
jgi:predicted enzyme involved in methoxymalonyl-ACP biosynthesis